MSRKLIFSISLVLVLGLLSTCYGILLSDFEAGLGGWWADAATLSLSTTGATSGTQALQVESPGGWKLNAKFNLRGFRDLLAVPGAMITADVTAFEADMTTTFMQVEMVINGQSNDDNGANNNIGWQELGDQDVIRDGQPHTYTWVLPEALSSAIAGTDDNISWFELALASNVEESSVTKFYIDNIQLVSDWAPPASNVLGDWENTDDGWYLDGGSPAGSSMTYSDTTGVTLNNYSLRLYMPGGGWRQGFRLDLESHPELIEPFRNSGKFQIDVTRLLADWGPGTDSGLHLVVNAGGDGWSFWDNYDYKGWWGVSLGRDDLQTVEWDYTSSLAKIQFDNYWYIQIFLILNYNASGTYGGVYYLDNCRLLMEQKAAEPNPADGATEVPREPILSWEPGSTAATHDVYFGDNYPDVSNVTRDNLASYPNVTYQNVDVPAFVPGTLELSRTYYWRVDEVNEPDIWTGDVWSFTVGEFLVVDDFEGYTDNDAAGETIWQAWIDGYGVDENGSQISNDFPPYAEQTVVHTGLQSMPYIFDNNLKYSEATMTLIDQRDWTAENIKKFSLWFRGHPGVLGSFTEAPAGTYTITGSGADIWDPSDEFHFAYKTLTGPGSIVAKVESVDNTDPWAKAGVMIRETLEPDSKHAIACMTPGSGVAAQGRIDTGGDSFGESQSGITAPHWVRLDRDISGRFTVFHSADGSLWESVQNSNPTNIQMQANVYVGLAVTAHSAGAKCQAVFSNVTITGNAGAQWANQDIGILSNDPEPMYVAIANADGSKGIKYHDDPNAAQINNWTEWTVDLKDFADQGVNLTDVNSLSIGFGDKNNIQAGGSGKVYFDDIRLYRSDVPIPVITISPVDTLEATGDNGTIISINGISVNDLILGTTTFAGEPKSANFPPQDADNFDLSVGASADDQAYVQTMFAVPVTTIFIIEKGGNDNGYMQCLDQNGDPLGEPVPFSPADFKDTGLKGVQNQAVAAAVVTVDVPVYGIRILPPDDKALGFDPTSVSGIAAQ